MKKRISIIFMAFAITFLIVFNINYLNSNNNTLSNVSFDNIEALADGEVYVGTLCSWQPMSMCMLWIQIGPGVRQYVDTLLNSMQV